MRKSKRIVWIIIFVLTLVMGFWGWQKLKEWQVSNQEAVDKAKQSAHLVDAGTFLSADPKHSGNVYVVVMPKSPTETISVSYLPSKAMLRNQSKSWENVSMILKTQESRNKQLAGLPQDLITKVSEDQYGEDDINPEHKITYFQSRKSYPETDFVLAPTDTDCHGTFNQEVRVSVRSGDKKVSSTDASLALDEIQFFDNRFEHEKNLSEIKNSDNLVTYNYTGRTIMQMQAKENMSYEPNVQKALKSVSDKHYIPYEVDCTNLDRSISITDSAWITSTNFSGGHQDDSDGIVELYGRYPGTLADGTKILISPVFQAWGSNIYNSAKQRRHAFEVVSAAIKKNLPFLQKDFDKKYPSNHVGKLDGVLRSGDQVLRWRTNDNQAVNGTPFFSTDYYKIAYSDIFSADYSFLANETELTLNPYQHYSD